MKRLATLIAFLAIGTLAFASVPTHHNITVDHTYLVQQTTLQPGHYKVIVDGNHATITQKHKTIISDLNVQTVPQKFHQTGLVSMQKSNKRELVAIELGGTRYKLTVP